MARNVELTFRRKLVNSWHKSEDYRRTADFAYGPEIGRTGSPGETEIKSERTSGQYYCLIRAATSEVSDLTSAASQHLVHCCNPQRQAMEEEEIQRFCLRWHHHQSSVVSALGGALQSGALADVTLSAGGSSVRAHRLVLAAGSQYFANLFKEVSAESGLVVVLGCSSSELRLLLTFMYTGEVTCSRRILPRLLRLATTLQVDGLTDANANMPTAWSMDLDDKESDTNPASVSSPRPGTKTFRLSPESDSRLLDDTSTSSQATPVLDYGLPELTKGFGLTDPLSEFMRKERPQDRISKLDQIVQQLYSTHKDVTPSVMLPESTSHGQPMIAAIDARTPATPTQSALSRRWRLHGGGGGGGGGALCTVCNKRLSNQYNLRVHLETHAGARHACHACNHVSRSRDALRKHVAYRHPPTTPTSHVHNKT